MLDDALVLRELTREKFDDFSLARQTNSAGYRDSRVFVPRRIERVFPVASTLRKL